MYKILKFIFFFGWKVEFINDGEGYYFIFLSFLMELFVKFFICVGFLFYILNCGIVVDRILRNWDVLLLKNYKFELD